MIEVKPRPISSGDRFGRLVTVERTASPGKAKWHCRCDCTKEKAVAASSLKRGLTMSCGCLQKERAAKASTTHGRGSAAKGRRDATYQTWSGMHTRCSNPRAKSFKEYGARGIFVCERWASFEAFLDDMGPKPSWAHSIDRADNDGPYSKGNCFWATAKQQARNRRNTIFVTIGCDARCLTDWCDRTGVSSQIADGRIRRGWDGARAVTEPVRGIAK